MPQNVTPEPSICNLSVEFYKRFPPLEIFSERKTSQRYSATHSKDKVALISGKVEVFRSKLQKLKKYAITAYHTFALVYKNRPS
jgi:hypothetical protein